MNNWLLPDKQELNQMYENLHKKGVGGFTDGSYWSSSEDSADFAWARSFSCGSQYASNKLNALRVRAVRAFQSSENYQIGETTETGIVFYKNGTEYKECKLKDEGLYNWHNAMKLFKNNRENYE